MDLFYLAPIAVFIGLSALIVYGFEKLRRPS